MCVSDLNELVLRTFLFWMVVVAPEKSADNKGRRTARRNLTHPTNLRKEGSGPKPDCHMLLNFSGCDFD